MAYSLVFNPFTGNFDFVGTSTGGTGDVNGPGSSTDTAIARFDGTTGKLIQNSLALLQDGGGIEAQGFIQMRLISQTVYVYADETILTVDPEVVTGGDLILEGSGELYIL